MTSFVRRNRLVLIALWFVFYCSLTLITPPLLDDADSVHAEVAREMLLRHDWTTLYANGIRYLEKAPLLYWSMAASMKLFGVHTSAARLPLALTVLALALAMESFARRAFASARAGLYAGLILLSSFGIFIFTRITIPDAMVCLWLTLAMLCYWRTEAQTEPNPFLCYAFAACCALNVLTKGLIGIVFPIAIVLVHLLLTRGIRGTLQRLRQFHPFASLLVFLVIAAPWHILIGIANPAQGNPGNLTFTHDHWSVPEPTQNNVHGWFWFYFVNEHLLRYLNLRVPRDYDTVPLALFWGLLLVWLMPWSGFLVHAFGKIEWRAAIASSPLFAKLRWLQARINPENHTVLLTPDENTRLLLGLWAAIPMLFFSLSTRQEYYVLPALPALILLITAWLNDEVDEAESFSVPNPLVVAGQRISVVLLVLGSMAALTAGFFILHAQQPSPNTDLATLLKQNPGDYALSFGHFLDLNAQAMGAFRTPLLITALALFGGTLASWLCRRHYKPHAANLWLAAATFAFLVAAHLGLQLFSPVLTSRQLANAIAPELKPGDLIVIHGEYEAASTLGFYLHRNDLHILDGRSSNLWYGSFFPDAPPIFEDTESLRRRWSGVQRIFLWTEPEHVPAQLGQTYFIAQSGGKEILSNQPNPF
ncbi:MAG: glycosyl transferase family 39 [Edaphobacter sp.]|nr:glycosyl transferase family 39 [Edaphobacter sp.]